MLMRTLPISVIIPHYNRPQFLQEALDSIRSQTLPPAEIIVVDDCSTAVARDELQKFRHISKIHANSVNLGVSESRNIGVELASNDWIAFLDDDDLYHLRKEWSKDYVTIDLKPDEARVAEARTRQQKRTSP